MVAAMSKIKLLAIFLCSFGLGTQTVMLLLRLFLPIDWSSTSTYALRDVLFNIGVSTAFTFFIGLLLMFVLATTEYGEGKSK